MQEQSKIEEHREFRSVFQSQISKSAINKGTMESLLLNNIQFINNKTIITILDHLGHQYLSQKTNVGDQKKMKQQKQEIIICSEVLLIDKFQYVILAYFFGFENKLQYDKRWNSCYQIINWVLKINTNFANQSKLEKIIVQIIYFLQEGAFPTFIKKFNQIICKKIIATQDKIKQDLFESSINSQKQILSVISRTKILYSLLCLNSTSIEKQVNLLKTMCVGIKSSSFQFLKTVEQKFFKKLSLLREDEKKTKNRLGALNLEHIYQICKIYDLSGRNSIKLSRISKIIEEDMNDMDNIVEKTGNTYTVLQINSPYALEFVFKELLLSFKTHYKQRRQLLKICFEKISKCTHLFYNFLIEAYSIEEDEEISLQIFRQIKQESLRHLSISRIKSLLKKIRPEMRQGISLKTSLQKSKNMIRLLVGLSKKFNSSEIMCQLQNQQTSTISINHIKKCKSLIFCLDFAFTQNCQILTFNLGSKDYFIETKYSFENKEIQFDIITVQADKKKQGIKSVIIQQKKQVDEYSYILVLVSISQQKKDVLQISIDGAYFQIGDKNATYIENPMIGPFSGTIREIYLLDHNIEVGNFYKRYLERCRKVIRVVSEQISEQKYLFSLDRRNIKQQKHRFWRKQTKIKYTDCRKIGFVSFSEALEQLGSLPNLLYLVSVQFQSPEQQPENVIAFYNQFFDFLRILTFESDAKLVKKWMVQSASYFGEVLWIILSKFYAIRQNRNFFNRFLDYFSCYSKLYGDSLKMQDSNKQLQLQFLIITNIYMNFQSWTKCSIDIQKMVYNLLSDSINSQSLKIKLLISNYYEKILSGIVFFYIENSADKINFEILNKLLMISEKICGLHSYSEQTKKLIKNNINTTISLITFCLKKKKSHSQNQKTAICMLLKHFSKIFLTENVLNHVPEIYPYILFEIGELLRCCDEDPNLISQLFSTGLQILIKMENLRKAYDIFLISNLRLRKDKAQTNFSLMILIIKSYSILKVQPLTDFDESLFEAHQIVIQSLLNNEQVQKIPIERLLSEIFSLKQKQLQKLLSSKNITNIIQLYTEENNLFDVGVMVLSRVIKFKIVEKTCLTCQKMYKWILKGLLSESKASKVQQIQSQQSKQSNTIEKQQMKQKKQEQEIKDQALQKKQSNQQQTPKQNKKIYIRLLTDILKQPINTVYLLTQSATKQLFVILNELGLFSDEYSWIKFPIQNSKDIYPKEGLDIGLLFFMKEISFTELKFLFQYYPLPYITDEFILTTRKVRNCSHFILPVYLLNQQIFILLHESQKSDNDQLFNIIQSSYKILIKLTQDKYLRSRLSLLDSILKYKKQIEGISKIQQIIKKVPEIIVITQSIFAQYFQKKQSEFQYIKKLEGLLLSLEEIKDKLQFHKFIKKNVKVFKNVQKQLNLLLNSYLLFIQVNYINERKLKLLQVKVQHQSNIENNTLGKKNVKKKSTEISDREFYKPYSSFIKQKIQQICKGYQKQSNVKEERWKKLAEKNMFWDMNKIKDNQCYQIDQKITGFYRLNLIKAKFVEVPYPRRRSFNLDSFSREEQISSLKYERSTNFNFVQDISYVEVKEQQQQEENLETIAMDNIESEQIGTLPQMFFYSQFVTQKGVYAGKLYYLEKQNCFIFKCTGYDSLPDEPVYKYSTIYHRLEDKSFYIKIGCNNHTQIFIRRYILRHTAIEIYTQHKSYFFNLFKFQFLQKFFKNIGNKIICITDLRGEFLKKRFTERWMIGAIDNFEYLMLINKYSGRTYNDLGQYPIMPWVITNYQSEEAQINKQFIKNKNNLRDLSVPAGKIGKEKFQKLKIRCQQISPQDYQIRFLYGTMISNPTTIYNLLIRLEPFISLHWDHQGRRIDHPDRLFSAVRSQFTTVLTQSSDNKQLIPQFYYWPEFLKNRNKIDLGVRQNREEVHAVKLPGWAQNPEQFVFKMRQVLQSPEVTQNLHLWIDLVFGFKSPYDVAQKYDNLYHFRTYEHDIFIFDQQITDHQQFEQKIKGAQITISQFGQVPYNIFTGPHPMKRGSNGIQIDKCFVLRKANHTYISDFDISKQGMILCMADKVQIYFADIMTIESSTSQFRQFPSNGSQAKLIDLTNQIWFTLKDGVFRIFNRKGPLNQLDISAQSYCCFNKYIILGIHSKLLVTIFEGGNKMYKTHEFFGHKSAVSLIKTSQVLDIIVSVDRDGLVMVHQFEKFKLVRQFELTTAFDGTYDDQIEVLCMEIHQMGYFIFLTRDQRLIVYTFLGELYLQQDISLIAIKGFPQKITCLQIMAHNKSVLLLATNKGNIYEADFIQIKRFSESYPFKTYSRIKENILIKCPRSQISIRQFYITLIPGENNPTYKIIVLYEDNALCCFIESSKIGEQIKNSKLLSNLGLF